MNQAPVTTFLAALWLLPLQADAADDARDDDKPVATSCSQVARINALNQEEEERIRAILAEEELVGEDRAKLTAMLEEYETVNHQQKRMFRRYCLDELERPWAEYQESGVTEHVNRVGAERK